MRHRLRKEHGIADGVEVVFSIERPKVKLLPFEAPNGEEAAPSDYQIVPGFRVRVLPVLGTIPAMFGQAMATHVVTQLAGLLVQGEPVVQLAAEHYSLLHRRLVEREELRFGTAAAVEVDVDEVVYLVKEVWRGRSARDQGSRDVGRGMWRSMQTMTLTRWDAARPPSVDNLVLFRFDEAEAHEGTDLEALREREPGLCAAVAATLARVRADF